MTVHMPTGSEKAQGYQKFVGHEEALTTNQRFADGAANATAGRSREKLALSSLMAENPIRRHVEQDPV
jgi:hypothetical protein